MAAGAGELSTAMASPPALSAPPLLLSLATALLSLTSLLPPVESDLTSPGNSGARQLGMFQCVPVKDFSWRPFRSHLRQGLPLRSSARRPALMAPVLALGPSLCAGTVVLLLPGLLLLSPEWSIVPSGLG